MTEVKDDEGTTKYIIETRKKKKDKWDFNLETVSLQIALQKKHFHWLITIRELGLRYDLFYRRKKRKNHKKK